MPTAGGACQPGGKPGGIVAPMPAAAAADDMVAGGSHHAAVAVPLAALVAFCAPPAGVLPGLLPGAGLAAGDGCATRCATGRAGGGGWGGGGGDVPVAREPRQAHLSVGVRKSVAGVTLAPGTTVSWRVVRVGVVHVRLRGLRGGEKPQRACQAHPGGQGHGVGEKEGPVFQASGFKFESLRSRGDRVADRNSRERVHESDGATHGSAAGLSSGVKSPSFTRWLFVH
jgi:hypothetical protein